MKNKEVTRDYSNEEKISDNAKVLLVAVAIAIMMMVSCEKQAQASKPLYTVWVGTGVVKVGYDTNYYKIENGYVIYQVDNKLFKSPECNISIIETN